jgi:uncharacterized iron-regulated membrane protein
MKKNIILSLAMLFTTLTFNILYGAPRSSAKTHHPLIQSNKNGQFIAIKPSAKNNTAEKSVHERTMKPVKSKEIETINFL